MKEEARIVQNTTKYRFSIPDALAVRIINRAFLTALTMHPEWFYDDFTIDTAYGCPGRCPWTGGRDNLEDDFDDGWAEEVAGLYEEAGAKYRLVFTNFLLRKPDLQDAIGNKVALQLSKRGGCSVMVSTPMMYQYMGRYPGLTRCWSTTTDFGKSPEEQIEKINRLSERDLVVIPYQFNNGPDLNRFTHPENLEVLINEDCVDNCPFRREHWTKVCEYALKGDDSQEAKQKIMCMWSEGREYVPHHRIHREQLDRYRQLGINHFKVCGRGRPQQVFQAYFEYFVRAGAVESFARFCDSYRDNFGRMVGALQ